MIFARNATYVVASDITEMHDRGGFNWVMSRYQIPRYATDVVASDITEMHDPGGFSWI